MLRNSNAGTDDGDRELATTPSGGRFSTRHRSSWKGILVALSFATALLASQPARAGFLSLDPRAPFALSGGTDFDQDLIVFVAVFQNPVTSFLESEAFTGPADGNGPWQRETIPTDQGFFRLARSIHCQEGTCYLTAVGVGLSGFPGVSLLVRAQDGSWSVHQLELTDGANYFDTELGFNEGALTVLVHNGSPLELEIWRSPLAGIDGSSFSLVTSYPDALGGIPGILRATLSTNPSTGEFVVVWDRGTLDDLAEGDVVAAGMTEGDSGDLVPFESPGFARRLRDSDGPQFDGAAGASATYDPGTDSHIWVGQGPRNPSGENEAAINFAARFEPDVDAPGAGGAAHQEPARFDHAQGITGDMPDDLEEFLINGNTVLATFEDDDQAHIAGDRPGPARNRSVGTRASAQSNVASVLIIRELAPGSRGDWAGVALPIDDTPGSDRSFHDPTYFDFELELSGTPKEMVNTSQGDVLVAGNGLQGGLGFDRFDPPAVMIEPGDGCVPSDTTLCLDDGRFEVTVTWRNFQGETGSGHAVSQTSETGFFWFFSPDNLELMTKTPAGTCGINDHHWFFGASLTNVEYHLRVEDTHTGHVKLYDNPLGVAAPAITDTVYEGCGSTAASTPESTATSSLGRTLAGLETQALMAQLETRARDLLSFGTARAEAPSPPGRGGREGGGRGEGTAEIPSGGTSALLLHDGRIQVEARWRSPQGAAGDGQAIALSNETGVFWFFGPGNLEVIVKALDACGLNQRFWVFAAGVTNLEVILTVTDLETGEVVTYTNPLGTDFVPVQDTDALASCAG